jgi:anti-anti-sigma factor
MRSQQSATPTATVSASPTTGTALVHLGGAIDPVVEPALREVVEQLGTAAPRTVLVDLAEVTFACSTLANLVVQVCAALPPEASLAVCRPSAMTRQVLTLAGVGWVPVLDAGPAAT